MVNLEPLMQRNFIDYASFVILDRAIPDIRDGCKPVQRRILTTLRSMHDGRFHKVANVIGETMKLHPHGEGSIGDALVTLANKEYFIEKQGNYGSILTGHAAAAPRYIECRLTPLALETLFNADLTEYVDSYDGRKQEPLYLPTKIPVVLLIGIEGIAVGMATRILPHNFAEVIAAQIKILKKKSFRLLPDFPGGGVMDGAEYEDGAGKVTVRALVESYGDKKIVIRELPFGSTTESMIASIEAAIQKGKIKISEINDFTTDKVEIELNLQRGAYASEVLPQLYAYTECEMQLQSNIIVIEDGRPAQRKVSEILRTLTERLVEIIRAELKLELAQLTDQQHWLTLEQIFIEKRVYKRIEKAETAQAVTDAVREGMKPYELLFVRALTDADVERLLHIQIRRISAYDIQKYHEQMKELTAAIKTANSRLRKITETTIAYLEELEKKYAKLYPRRTRVSAFDAVDVKAVATADIRMSYDPATGFFGSDVKGGEPVLKITEFEKVLIISNDGAYRIIGPTDKLLVGKIIYCEKFDPEAGVEMTVVYRDTKRFAFAKRVHIHKFIRGKEYTLAREPRCRVDFLSTVAKPGIAHLTFAAAPRQRIKSAEFDLDALALTGVSARGIRMAPKPVASVKVRPAT